MDFLGGDREPYLYIDEVNSSLVDEALGHGFSVALHSHVFKQVHRLASAFKLLYDYRSVPNFLWIIDTAHLTVARDDPVRALHRFRDKLVAVHLKDWTPAFGRSSHRYSKGFVQLGAGTIKLDVFLKALGELFAPASPPSSAPIRKPWLIWELDWSRNPAASVVEAAQWFFERELLPAAPRSVPVLPTEVVTKEQPAPMAEGCLERSRFIESLWKSVDKPAREFYADVAAAFQSNLHTQAVALWAYSPAHHLLSLLAVDPVTATLPEEQVDASGTLAWATLEEQAIKVFDLSSDDPGSTQGYTGKQFAFKDFARENGSRWLVVVPVFHSYNPHHIRFVVQCLMKDKPEAPALRALSDAAADVARIADTWLNELWLHASAEASVHSQSKTSGKALLDDLVKAIRLMLDCEGCSAFMSDPTGKKLEEGASTGLQWREDLALDQRFYERGKGLVGSVLADAEPLLVRRAREHEGWEGKSWEGPGPKCLRQHDACLLTPIIDAQGTVLGVLRCSNKITIVGHEPYFSDDDLAVADAMLQAAIPYYLRVEGDRLRRVGGMKLNHELKRPVMFAQIALGRLEKELVPRFRNLEVPGAANLSSALEWLKLSDRLLQSQDLVLQDTYQPHPERVDLKADVIDPVLRSLDITMRAKRLPSDKISVLGFDALPAIWVDANHFRQIVFNLLDNAIKYAPEDPSQFFVKITAQKPEKPKRIILQFADNGKGIPPGWQLAIFREGIRAPNVLNSNVQGNGFGLSILKKLVEAHKGRIWVSKLGNPTEFTITLPRSLTERPLVPTETSK